MILSKETIQAYNASRNCANKNIVCHAPLVNLNFEQTGEVRACCYNFKHVLGKWPEQSLREIWTGQKLADLRSFVADNNLGGGCIECGKMIEAGNYQGVRAKYYDEFATHGLADTIAKIKRTFTGGFVYPKVMEFELSNECNLECIMCNGSFSSSIRKNREKLPPIVSPYNDKFVDELDEFIPHLTDAKFLGGEPFMIDIYLKIWERILKINPSIRMHITTNGTFLNNRIKDLLEGLNAGIILSIDSVDKETYKKIRVNGNFEKVMENLVYFMDYTKRKKTFISMAACPMTNNWRELPQMLEFCLERDIALYFNVVFTPFDLTLRELSAEALEEVIAFLAQYPLPSISGNPQSPRNLSISAYHDFIQLLKGWAIEKSKPAFMDVVSTTNNAAVVWSLEDIKATIQQLIALETLGFTEQQRELQNHLGAVFAKTPKGKEAEALYCFIQEADALANKTTDVHSWEKLQKLALLIEQHDYRESILSMASQAPPTVFAALMAEKELAELEQIFAAQFNARV
ncbi:MAG: radical SAM protein [Chitinophagales bacterium]|nr:radical SAM protein [Chitinophagales bacterium]